MKMKTMLCNMPGHPGVCYRSLIPDRRRFLIAALALIAALLTGMSGASAAEPTKPMRIGVIGAGSLGGTVGSLLVKAGHEVKFSSRHPEELESMARELGPRASVGTAREAAEFGTVLLFAVPYDALPQLGQDLKEQIRGKIVLDACNPRSGTEEAAGVAQTSARLLAGTRLVRAFSAVDATAAEASFKRQTDKLGVPLASDDAEAMQVAARLVRDVGCEPVIVGNLAAAKSFQRGGPGFRANTTAPKLRQLLRLPEGK
jgi:predicted dinucleotide-binding enzyme